MDVWRRYKNGEHTTELRNILIEHYMYYVWSIAKRFCQKLPDSVELDDVASNGMFGLMDAIELFDLDKKVSFIAYSRARILGAIRDGIRNMDWVPKLARRRQSEHATVREALIRETEKLPTNAEMAEGLDCAPDEYMAEVRKRNYHPPSTVSLSRKRLETDSQKDVCEIDLLMDEHAVMPDKTPQKNDVKELLIRGLDRHEQMALTLYYYDGMTMKETGAALGLSESRVSQILTACIERKKENELYPGLKAAIEQCID